MSDPYMKSIAVQQAAKHAEMKGRCEELQFSLGVLSQVVDSLPGAQVAFMVEAISTRFMKVDDERKSLEREVELEALADAVAPQIPGGADVPQELAPFFAGIHQ